MKLAHLIAPVLLLLGCAAHAAGGGAENSGCDIDEITSSSYGDLTLRFDTNNCINYGGQLILEIKGAGHHTAAHLWTVLSRPTKQSNQTYTFRGVRNGSYVANMYILYHDGRVAYWLKGDQDPFRVTNANELFPYRCWTSNSNAPC